MKNNKPIASLSLDLDDKWTYMKTHGDPGWETFPSYLELVVPRTLDFFEEQRLMITFFVVGQDVAIEANHATMQHISKCGHEIANHSFHHDPWLQTYTEDEIYHEISIADDAIEQVTGQRPVGFRGPGFSFSDSTFRALAKKGYLYDASTFPNFLNPVARAYFHLTSNLDEEELNQRKMLFGTFRDGFRPIIPYRCQLGELTLLEIPVTTFPLFRVPIHLSYILYISQFSKRLALAYFKAAMKACKLSKVQPSILLHPLDFLGVEDNQGLLFFPSMRMPKDKKMDVVRETLHILTSEFKVCTMKEHAVQANQESARKNISPKNNIAPPVDILEVAQEPRKND